jgi:hypothetical protein
MKKGLKTTKASGISYYIWQLIPIKLGRIGKRILTILDGFILWDTYIIIRF